MSFAERIRERTAQVAVVGLGYVGLPLAVAFLKAGFRVAGIDVDQRKVETLLAGESYIPDIPAEAVAQFRQGSDPAFTPTTSFDAVAASDVIFICVPTPFDAHKTPDLSYILSATTAIEPGLRAGQLVVLQSTTYPGTTEEVVRPILERGGLRAGVDFSLAFSPERVDPGNTRWTVENTPKVVGGLTPSCTEAAVRTLECITPNVHVVSSPRAAEATKLLENVFRSVNIALVNELAMLAERMGLDIWEVIAAAATKPFGFMPFLPGPGVGGHCIPIDPFYLSWKAREYDFTTHFIDLAAETNLAMPYHVADLVTRALSSGGGGLRGARVLLIGATFKPDVTDTRNAPTERVMHLLLNLGANVEYHDPFAPELHVEPSAIYPQPLQLRSSPLDEHSLAGYDCVVLLVRHRDVDYELIGREARLIVDTVNATHGLAIGGRVVRLGDGGSDDALVPLLRRTRLG